MRNDGGEIVKLLKVGLNCCEEDVGTRLDLRDAIEMNDFYFSCANESDVYYIRRLSDDFFSSIYLRFK